MLLICPVRPGDTNEELRYAMRSWETNLILPGDLAIMTVGHRPSWLEPDLHVEGNKYDSMPLNVWDNVRLGAESAQDACDVYGNDRQEVVYMNDDFFCMDPVGAILPVRRNATLAEHIAKFPPNASNWWPKSLALTASWLDGLGFPHPYSYEAHRPLLASPSGMIEALSQWQGGMDGPLPQWRTAYGVINRVEAYPVVDAKLSAGGSGVGTPWLSTSDEVWRRYALAMRKRFQKPSRWEKN